MCDRKVRRESGVINEHYGRNALTVSFNGKKAEMESEILLRNL